MKKTQAQPALAADRRPEGVLVLVLVLVAATPLVAPPQWAGRKDLAQAILLQQPAHRQRRNENQNQVLDHTRCNGSYGESRGARRYQSSTYWQSVS